MGARGTHLDGGSPVCRARPCRHFHASVADAVYLAIRPGLYQGFKLLPYFDMAKMKRQRWHARHTLQGKPGVHVMSDP